MGELRLTCAAERPGSGGALVVMVGCRSGHSWRAECCATTSLASEGACHGQGVLPLATWNVFNSVPRLITRQK